MALALPLCALIVAGGAFVAYVTSLASSAPSIDALAAKTHGSNSVVLAADGSRLGYIRSSFLRTPVAEDRIPEVMRRATVTVEDHRFYEHTGLDHLGLLSVTFRNVRSGEVIEGGSTLTMQLVRNLYLSDERTLRRKVHEAKLAAELEERRGKRCVGVVAPRRGLGRARRRCRPRATRRRGR